MCVLTAQLLSRVRLLATPWTVAPRLLCPGALQAGILERVPSPPPGHLPDPGIAPLSPALQADSLRLSPQGRPKASRPEVRRSVAFLMLHSCQLSLLTVLQSLSHGGLCDPSDCSTPDFPSFTMSPSSLRLMSTEPVTPSNHLIPSLTSVWFQNVFIPLEGNPRSTSSHSPVPDSQPQATTNLLPISLDSLTLDI